MELPRPGAGGDGAGLDAGIVERMPRDGDARRRKRQILCISGIWHVAFWA